MFSVEIICSNRFDLPFQVYPDLSSVIPVLNAIEYDSPLDGYDSHKEVEPRATETIPHQKSAHVAKT